MRLNRDEIEILLYFFYISYIIRISSLLSKLSEIVLIFGITVLSKILQNKLSYAITLIAL